MKGQNGDCDDVVEREKWKEQTEREGIEGKAWVTEMKGKGCEGI